MPGPPSSAASRSSSHVWNPALIDSSNERLPGTPAASASSRNTHIQTPQSALDTHFPSEPLRHHPGNQQDAGFDASAGPVYPDQADARAHNALFDLPVHSSLHAQDSGIGVHASQNGVYPPSKVNSRVDATKPSPELSRSWDGALKFFFTRAGLTQTMQGFGGDMLVMNPAFERNELPSALEDLKQMLYRMTGPSPSDIEVPALDRRKLDFVRHSADTEILTPGSMNGSISLLLSRKRARNDASNQSEFIVNKRQRLDSRESATTARVDAKTVDREAMMKFDIAKNDEGPLRRTVQSPSAAKDEDKDRPYLTGMAADASDRLHSGLDERLKNLEEHLAMRYVPSAPVALSTRLQLIEEHIINLEREYPPWAALHFNQPRRGWPAPPRPTPVIVSSHLTSTAAQREFSASLHQDAQSSPLSEAPVSRETKGKGRAQSSLQRAVLEKLEVQKAMNDMKGPTS